MEEKQQKMEEKQDEMVALLNQLISLQTRDSAKEEQGTDLSGFPRLPKKWVGEPDLPD